MKKQIAYLSLVISISYLTSCNSKQSDEKEEVVNQLSIEEPKVIVEKFYMWYLSEFYNKKVNIAPRIILTSGNAYTLDTSKYFSIIKGSGYFSKSFIDNERKGFEKCTQDLKLVNKAEIDSCECSPSEFTQNCGFISYYYWLYHQGEPTEGIKVLNQSINNNDAEVLLTLVIDKNTTQDSIYVTLEKQNVWRIVSIRN